MMKILLLTLLLVSPSWASELSFRWLGISGFILSDEKSTIVIDPAFTRVSPFKYIPGVEVESDSDEVQYWSARCQIKSIDAIFVNHAHSDHVIDAPALIKKFGGKLYGSESTLMIGRGQGLSENQMIKIDPGKTYQVGDFKIEVFHTPHGKHFGNTVLMDGDITSPLPAKTSAWNYRAGTNMSFFITHPQKTFLFQSVGKVPDPDVLKDLRPDILLLTIVNRGKGNDFITKRIIPSGAKIVIPLHHDNFLSKMKREGDMNILWGMNIDEVQSDIKKLAPNVKVIWPQYCQELKF
ncbi:MAG: MBL fold metallo-hydrolase [Bacteriovoracaceae bacterium]